MPKRYSRELRRVVCERLVAGEKVPSLSEELGYPSDPLSREAPSPDRRRANRGIKSFQADELAQPQKNIVELEAELKAVKAASALFNGEPVNPKDWRMLSF